MVSRVPTSVITVMQQPIRRESNQIASVGVPNASHCTTTIHTKSNNIANLDHTESDFAKDHSTSYITEAALSGARGLF